MLDLPSGEEKYFPSKSSNLRSEYENLRISGLSQIIRFQGKNKKRDVKPKFFSHIYLFAYVAVSATKFIKPEKASFSVNLLRHE